jgi:hypothetical protein
MRIEAHCPDGTDRNCHGTVTIDLPYTRLTDENIEPEWVGDESDGELERVTITPPADPQWLTENAPWLSECEVDSINTDGFFVLEASDFPAHDSCPACGSSETYDREGNNITAL